LASFASLYPLGLDSLRGYPRLDQKPDSFDGDIFRGGPADGSFDARSGTRSGRERPKAWRSRSNVRPSARPVGLHESREEILARAYDRRPLVMGLLVVLAQFSAVAPFLHVVLKSGRSRLESHADTKRDLTDRPTTRAIGVFEGGNRIHIDV
jgi:hypothetical protein